MRMQRPPPPPRLGDILVFSSVITDPRGNPDGHVAIIREVGNDYVKVIQQNISQNSDDSLRFDMDPSNGKYNVSASALTGTYTNYSVLGWLRKP